MYRCVHVCAGMCVYLCPLILPGALSSYVFPSSLPTGIYSVLSAALRMDAGFRDPGSEARAAVATAIPWGILAKARRRKRKKESQRPRQGCFRGETWDVWRMLVNGAETDRTGWEEPGPGCRRRLVEWTLTAHTPSPGLLPSEQAARAPSVRGCGSGASDSLVRTQTQTMGEGKAASTDTSQLDTASQACLCHVHFLTELGDRCQAKARSWLCL